VPVVGSLLIVGALLFFGLIGLSAWFEPALTDAAAKLGSRRRPPRSWRRRRASSTANDGWGAYLVAVCGVGAGEVVAARRAVPSRGRHRLQRGASGGAAGSGARFCWGLGSAQLRPRRKRDSVMALSRRRCDGLSEPRQTDTTLAEMRRLGL
jgi:hypothetical protein